MEIFNQRDLLKFFISLFPEFETVWNSEKNYHRNNNTFTPHGICAEFSNYFKENYTEFSNEHLKTLFDEVEKLIEYSEDGNEIDNALCTCFLENIAQTESGNFAQQFMGKQSKKFFHYWN